MQIEIYTDGGCRGNGTMVNPKAAAAAILLVPNEEPRFYVERLNFQQNTNNQAEIFAVIRGLELLKKYYNITEDFVKDKLIIYSDSNYTIQGITNWINGWRANGWKTANKEPVKNKELWIVLDELVNELKDSFTIEFVKVKGHSGDYWNEYCDDLVNHEMDLL